MQPYPLKYLRSQSSPSTLQVNREVSHVTNKILQMTRLALDFETLIEW
jgi:hypothetical protein